VKVGIVGLPNVGKSTLFNALTRTHNAEARNYPFCTIHPNVGIVKVPDARLDFLQKMTGTERVIPAAIEFVDIAGLVAGASRGEGLGNKFLAHIREMDALVHVVRCFEGGDILHTVGDVDSRRDMEIIETELLLADLESILGQEERLKKRTKGLDRDAIQASALAGRLSGHLSGGRPAHSFPLAEGERELMRQFCLLTAKPVLYACNVDGQDLADPAKNRHVATVIAHARRHPPAEVCVVSAQMEEDLGDLAQEEAAQFLGDLGVADGGVSDLIRRSYALLRLASFFTAGVPEVRAWTFPIGMKAPACAGIIHSDFEKGFIRAEVVAFEDLKIHGDTAGAKSAGRYRVEGRDYALQDGDVVHFRVA
jgi:GTP-binding protein YchF